MKLIIFDIDGTLANTFYIDDNCFAKAFEDVLGINKSQLDWDGCGHITDSAYTLHFFRQLYDREPSPQEITQLREHFVILLKEKQQSDPHLFMEVSGAADFYRQLSDRSDVVLGIATGGWRKPATFKLNNIGIYPDGAFFETADEHITKTESISTVISKAKEKHVNGTIQDIVYIGDRLYDYETARQLGIRFLGVDNRHRRELQETDAPLIISNYMEQDKILAHLGLD